MLKSSTISQLKESKNLLAFSAGGDSTALLFLLLEHNIAFDIAIVDYGVREQSKEEVTYAKTLSEKYNFNCYEHSAKDISSNFEANAREIRYDFFKQLIEKHHYNNLLTAHHLGDRFEWMLMQFCKGAGCSELAGMKEFEKRNNYNLIRPLLHKDKEELLIFLQKNSIKYFEDSSNIDQSIKRNFFRHNYAKPLLKEYQEGIKKSFEYIDEDREILTPYIEIQEIDEFGYFPSTGNKRADLYAIDRYLKSKLHLTTTGEKTVLKKEKISSSKR